MAPATGEFRQVEFPDAFSRSYRCHPTVLLTLRREDPSCFFLTTEREEYELTAEREEYGFFPPPPGLPKSRNSQGRP